MKLFLVVLIFISSSSSFASKCTLRCSYISATEFENSFQNIAGDSYEQILESCKSAIRNELALDESAEIISQEKEFNRKDQEVLYSNLLEGAIYARLLTSKKFSDSNGFKTGEYMGLATRENSCK